MMALQVPLVVEAGFEGGGKTVRGINTPIGAIDNKFRVFDPLKFVIRIVL